MRFVKKKSVKAKKELPPPVHSQCLLNPNPICIFADVKPPSQTSTKGRGDPNGRGQRPFTNLIHYYYGKR